LNVKRPHLETVARWMEQEGRMASTIGRRLSTLSSFYRYCQTRQEPRAQRSTSESPRRITHPGPGPQRTRRPPRPGRPR
jgi:site-specific recombinase XerD